LRSSGVHCTRMVPEEKEEEEKKEKDKIISDKI
jgi:hypothetical protein